jgi:hypothetical protein
VKDLKFKDFFFSFKFSDDVIIAFIKT